MVCPIQYGDHNKHDVITKYCCVTRKQLVMLLLRWSILHDGPYYTDLMSNITGTDWYETLHACPVLIE